MLEHDDPAVDPAHLAQLKSQLHECWQQLPPGDQAEVALALLRETFEGEYGPWMWGALFVLSRGEELADGEIPGAG